jgi:hypothetical protein
LCPSESKDKKGALKRHLSCTESYFLPVLHSFFESPPKVVGIGIGDFGIQEGEVFDAFFGELVFFGHG